MKSWPNPSDVQKVAVDPPWIPEIPEAWMAVRLGAILTQSPERNGRSPVGEMLSVSGYRGVEPKEYEHEEKRRTDEELTDYRVVRPGRLVVNTMWMNHRGLGVSEHTGHVSPAYRVYNIDSRIDRRFLHHLLRSEALVGKYCSLLYGIRPNSLQVKEADLRAIYVPVPTVDVQSRIADFLDRETDHIDRLIEKKEHLIALLEEKRSALITRVVTKGLEPDVPMKDSGVEWIGEIPEHWEARRVCTLSIARSGATPHKAERGYWDGEVPWVSPKDMKQRHIKSSQDHITAQALRETGIKVVDPPAVLIVVRGMILAHSFPVGITSVPVTINQDMKALLLDDDVEPPFLAWSFVGLEQGILKTFVDEAAHGTKAIRMERWRSLTIPLPGMKEQTEIAEALDVRSSQIDWAILKIHEGITLLRERRSALITAAVTGQINVEEYEASHRAPLALEEGQPPDSSTDAVDAMRETEESLR